MTKVKIARREDKVGFFFFERENIAVYSSFQYTYRAAFACIIRSRFSSDRSNAVCLKNTLGNLLIVPPIKESDLG